MLSITKEIRDLFGIEAAAPVKQVAAVETFEVQNVDFYTNAAVHHDALENELRRLQQALRYSDMTMLDEAKLVRFIEAVKTFKAAFKSTSVNHPTAKITREKSDTRMRYTLEIFSYDHTPLASVSYFNDL